jgi:hypothetical protein
MAHRPATGPDTQEAERADALPPAGPRRRRPPRLVAVSLVAAGWALLYALYRAYYGLGGTAGMFGPPSSEALWRSINLAGGAVVF